MMGLVKPIRFSQSARRHRIGKAHAYYVMATGTYAFETDPKTGAPTVIFSGLDDRGAHLTVVVVELADRFLVIHVKPTYPKER